MQQLNKYWFFLSLMIFIAGCAAGTSGSRPVAAEGPHRVEVVLSGLKCCGTTVRVGLFNSSSHWLKLDRVFKARLLIADGDSGSVTLYGLPAGDYAVAAFQDTNGNGKLDRWFGLLPREPVAFSQVKKWRTPPKFGAAAFAVPGIESVEVTF